MKGYSLQIKELSDKLTIEKFLREDPFYQIYSIGDLDDFFWPDTKWYALTRGKEIKCIFLIYDDNQYPVLLALNHRKQVISELSLREIAPILPSKFYAHLTEDLKVLFEIKYQIKSFGIHYKMGLIDYMAIKEMDTSGVVRLTAENSKDIQKLYEISYPNNWFNERMLKTGQYFGIIQNDKLISIAGVHVYSEQYRVAALGNITTHPEYRNRGFGKLVTAALCQSLIRNVDHIGLNVHVDNTGAITCYKNLGFEVVGTYEECLLTRTTSLSGSTS